MTTEIKKFKPDAFQLEILEGLKAEAAKETTTAEFCRKYLGNIGRSAFDQMLDAIDPKRGDKQSYFDKIKPETIAAKFIELRATLEDLPSARMRLAAGEREIIPTTKLRALNQAVIDAKARSSAERVILYLGPTGGSKTTAMNYVALKCNARRVEVRQAWRHSDTGYVPLMDICRAAGLRNLGRMPRIASMEQALIDYCAERNLVFCFDEAEHLSRSSINCLKLLLNRTRIIPIVFIIPEKYEELKNLFPSEMDQFRRRIFKKIDASKIDPADAKLFFPEGQFEHLENALTAILRHANLFGHYSLLARVVEGLKPLPDASHKDVLIAIKDALIEMDCDLTQIKQEITSFTRDAKK